MPMCLRLAAIVAVLQSLAMVGSPLPASAQTCPTTCVQSTHHWTFQNIASGDDLVIIGMSCGATSCRPVACKSMQVGQSTEWVAGGYANFTYPAPQLSQNTSICLGGGHDRALILRAGQTTTCLGPLGGTVAVQGFDANDRQLTISGESGHDYVDLGKYDYAGYVALCGGTGNDYLIGSYDTQYIAGGGGHDYIRGGDDYDDLRGGTDADLIAHWAVPDADAGVDKLRGEGGGDCVDISASFAATSTCGENTDYYSGSRPASCETPVDDCCVQIGVC